MSWENSRRFPTPPLVSPRIEIWGMTAEIPYRWRVTSQIWVLVGWSNSFADRPIRSTLQMWVVTRHQYGILWARSSNIISRGHQRWRRLMSVDFDCDCLELSYLAFNLLFFLSGPWCWPGFSSQITCQLYKKHVSNIFSYVLNVAKARFKRRATAVSNSNEFDPAVARQ